MKLWTPSKRDFADNHGKDCFGEKWLKWMGFFISTICLSILVNGTSPHLLLVVMDVSSCLVLRAAQRCFISSFGSKKVVGKVILEVQNILREGESRLILDVVPIKNEAMDSIKKGFC